MRIPYGNHTHGAYFSVGITAFNPRLQFRSSLSGMHTIICTHALQTRRAQRGRASTRPYTARIYHLRQRPIHHRNAPPRSWIYHHRQRPGNHHNAPSRSCRGDWEVARNTRIADTPDVTRASFHSPLHCMYIPPTTPYTSPRCLPRSLCRQRHANYCADGGVSLSGDAPASAAASDPVTVATSGVSLSSGVSSGVAYSASISST